MNNSVLPQNSLIRGTLGRNVTKKNVSRWAPQPKKNEPSFYNKYLKNTLLKNTFSSFLGSTSSEENTSNASTVVSEPEATSIMNSSSNNNSTQGGEYERLIRRYKAQAPNNSFGSFATRSLKKGGRRTKRRRSNRKSRRSNRK
jgi:hypothetical protein